MQCRFTFKQMKTSQSLAAYTEPKVINKIEKFSTKPIEAHLTFSVEGQQHRVHCSVMGGDGFNIQVDASCPDMYGSVDLMVHKLETQLKKQKEKLKKHKFSKDNLRFLETSEPISIEDCDSVPVDADDLLKYEKAKSKQVANG